MKPPKLPVTAVQAGNHLPILLIRAARAVQAQSLPQIRAAAILLQLPPVQAARAILPQLPPVQAARAIRAQGLLRRIPTARAAPAPRQHLTRRLLLRAAHLPQAKPTQALRAAVILR